MLLCEIRGRGSDARRVNGDEAIGCVASDVERGDVRQAAYPHGGHEARVMDLNAGHAGCEDESTPLRVHGRAVRQQRKQALQEAQPPDDRRPALGEAVAGGGAGRHVPKLDESLGGRAWLISLPVQFTQGGANRGVKRMVMVREAQQDVGVYEVIHGRLRVVRVNAFAADGLV